ncbi:single-stranded DNA-binding protein [Facklamia miroungae]|uniref:Single-stranded DNA-binding protein n=1 Tax=Facklamia miroungae TaxID=120956 RepID=A0A1G7RRD9_9LACT|nr:single-stranded DNA-binding protein [Facklamia miroungae]NKZ29313.1 single-stranded DNA-binding protein [Facklamia miroungae]SDG13174.1 single-strand DNA-binding protein [Facklamia miroungae]
MNQVVFVGRLCREVQLREVGESAAVTNNVIAIKRPFKDRNGESITDFIPFVAWNGLAKMMHKYACKGQRIALSGTMQSRTYLDTQNEEVYVIECNASEITLLDKPKSKKESKAAVKMCEMELRPEDMQVAQETVQQVLNNIRE